MSSLEETLAPRPLPFATAAFPGLGGAIKVSPEDFEVEELPLGPLSGAGEHLYLWIEKRGRDTAEVAQELARAFGVSERDVGYAGLKDRQAVTRQWFSLVARGLPEGLTLSGARVLAAERHAQKLRTGMLRGNRFRIRLRGVARGEALEPLLQSLAHTGVPNWFGPQRFGRYGDNALVGAALVGLGAHPLAARAQRDRFLRKLSLSALQSELFNRLLADRVREGRLASVEVGDVVIAPEDSRPIGIAALAPWQPRVERFEVAVTGPLVGSRAREAQGVPGEREARVLAEAGLTSAHLERGGDELRGTRRPYRFKLEGVQVAETDDGLTLSFELPPGAYATSILRELTRAATDEAPENPEA